LWFSSSPIRVTDGSVFFDFVTSVLRVPSGPGAFVVFLFSHPPMLKELATHHLPLATGKFFKKFSRPNLKPTQELSIRQRPPIEIFRFFP